MSQPDAPAATKEGELLGVYELLIEVVGYGPFRGGDGLGQILRLTKWRLSCGFAARSGVGLYLL